MIIANTPGIPIPSKEVLAEFNRAISDRIYALDQLMRQETDQEYSKTLQVRYQAAKFLEAQGHRLKMQTTPPINEKAS